MWFHDFSVLLRVPIRICFSLKYNPVKKVTILGSKTMSEHVANFRWYNRLRQHPYKKDTFQSSFVSRICNISNTTWRQRHRVALGTGGFFIMLRVCLNHQKTSWGVWTLIRKIESQSNCERTRMSYLRLNTLDFFCIFSSNKIDDKLYMTT